MEAASGKAIEMQGIKGRQPPWRRQEEAHLLRSTSLLALMLATATLPLNWKEAG
jgi:hypothetical protein